ncbi:MAG: hypothetical protein HC837_10010 [Chloroflexaceae bacterium]|nr:hypothetical protein [Chloroflexaceae bacterium]
MLGLTGMVVGWRQQWRESVLALLLLALHLAFYSTISYWHGDGSWGPRYLVFVLPFLYLPAAGLFAVVQEQRFYLVRLAIAVLVATSFTIQLLPILFNFNTYLQLSGQSARYYQPQASPLVAHPRLWFDRLQEWSLSFAAPPGVAVLTQGFSYSEGDRTRHELLPRWTLENAQIRIYPAYTVPLEGHLIVADHRPWTTEHPLPRANFALLLDGNPLADVERTDLTGEQIYWELRFTLTPQQARWGSTLTLQSDTWNPTLVTSDNPRNEDLGLFCKPLN